MPEAVDSNSTIAPEIHPERLMDGLHDTLYALQAYRVMLGSTIETDVGFSNDVSSGICLILESITENFDCQIKEVGKLINNDAKADKSSLSSYGQLCQKIIALRMKIMQEVGQSMTREAIREVISSAVNDCTKIVERLNGDYDFDLLEADNLLPALELKIREELAIAVDQEQRTTPKTLREEIIAEKLRQGISIEQLSQAFHIRASAIRRVMEKLTQQEQLSTLQQAV